jgi:type I restriction enzyme S subunit
MNRPIGVAEQVTTELTRSLPAGMQSALPTIEELEAEAAEVPFPEESGDGDEDKAAREAVMSEMASLFDDEMIEPLSAATKAMKEAEVVTALPEPDDDPGSSDLPEGWTVAALGAGLVADVQPGFACGKHNQDGSGIAHLRPMNITSDGVISLSVVKFVPAEEVDREERHVRVGDVLFNNTNSPELVGKTAYYGEPEERAFSNHMTRLRCTNGVLDAKFCSLSLHQRWREGYFAAACNNHVSQASISRSVLLNTEVPLPPLTEQRRIVEQVEALLASVNAARARLESVPALLKRFRQSVLAAACSGRLTAEWREEQTDLEPTARLLERIRAERREKEGSRYREPVAPDTSELPELPGSWAWASMDELTTRVTSGSRDWTRYYGRGTGTFLMAQNIRPGYLDLSYRQIVDPPAGNRDRERSQVQTGDLLVTIVGANTGDLCPVISELPEHYVCQSVALMRPVQSALMPFLNLSFNSPEHGRGYFEKCFYGAGRPHLSFDQLRAAPVPLPPLVEQTEIVHRVKNLYAFAESIENRVEAAAKRTEKVTQAVLAKAFRGELVPTEAELARKEEREYEPASVLLQRVRTQPAEQQWIRKSRRTAARNGGTG